MIVFLLIVTAVGFIVWSILADVILLGIAAFGVALASLCAIVIAGWLGRRRRGQAQDEAADDEPAQDEPAQDRPAGDEVVENDGTPVVGHEFADDHATTKVSEAVADDTDTALDEPAAERTGESPASISVAEPDPELVVIRVIPGRKRFHQTGCTSLTGRDSEELTREEAEEEGFTPCSICCQVGPTIRRAG